MKVVYKQNPLRSEVILDEFDKKELWYKTKIELLEERLFDVYFHLNEDGPHRAFKLFKRTIHFEKGEYFDLKRARKAADGHYFISDKRGEEPEINEDASRLANRYREALMGPHIGDCTCMAASCMKCHAEHLLGIDTIKGLSKHPASHVAGAFGKTGDIKEALDILKNYEPKGDCEGWEVRTDRWRQEAKQAHEWLVKYRDAYFPL